jgi:hypothetical protein
MIATSKSSCHRLSSSSSTKPIHTAGYQPSASKLKVMPRIGRRSRSAIPRTCGMTRSMRWTLKNEELPRSQSAISGITCLLNLWLRGCGSILPRVDPWASTTDKERNHKYLTITGGILMSLTIQQWPSYRCDHAFSTSYCDPSYKNKKERRIPASNVPDTRLVIAHSWQPPAVRSVVSEKTPHGSL